MLETYNERMNRILDKLMESDDKKKVEMKTEVIRVAKRLRDIVRENGSVSVGMGSEEHLETTPIVKRLAVVLLEREGYIRKFIKKPGENRMTTFLLPPKKLTERR